MLGSLKNKIPEGNLTIDERKTYLKSRVELMEEQGLVSSDYSLSKGLFVDSQDFKKLEISFLKSMEAIAEIINSETSPFVKSSVELNETYKRNLISAGMNEEQVNKQFSVVFNDKYKQKLIDAGMNDDQINKLTEKVFIRPKSRYKPTSPRYYPKIEIKKFDGDDQGIIGAIRSAKEKNENPDDLLLNEIFKIFFDLQHFSFGFINDNIKSSQLATRKYLLDLINNNADSKELQRSGLKLLYTTSTAHILEDLIEFNTSKEIFDSLTKALDNSNSRKFKIDIDELLSRDKNSSFDLIISLKPNPKTGRNDFICYDSTEWRFFTEGKKYVNQLPTRFLEDEKLRNKLFSAIEDYKPQDLRKELQDTKEELEKTKEKLEQTKEKLEKTKEELEQTKEKLQNFQQARKSQTQEEEEFHGFGTVDEEVTKTEEEKLNSAFKEASQHITTKREEDPIADRQKNKMLNTQS